MGAKVVFVGGGHTHVLALQRLAKTWPAGIKPVLVTAHWQTPYSGMLPGYVAGVYRRDECFINLRRVAEKFGATLIESPAVHLDTDACLLTLADGQKLLYDILSLNLGGNISPPFGGEDMCPVKPIDGFMRRLEWLDKEEIQNVAVVGAGAGGVEVALAIDARRKSGGSHLPPMRIQLVDDVLLADYPAALSGRLRVAMLRRGINIVEDARAIARRNAALLLDDGRQLPADKVIFATPVGAPAWLADSALALSEKGFVCVDPCLRSVSHTRKFLLVAIAPSMSPASRLNRECLPCVRRRLWRIIYWLCCKAVRPARGRRR